MTPRIIPVLLLAGCANQQPTSSVASTNSRQDADSGAPDGARGLSGGQAEAATDGSGGFAPADRDEAAVRGGGGSAEEPWVDTFDPSGCEHPPVIADCHDGWCKIAPGCFIMGSPENEWNHAPQERRVKTTLTRSFVIQQTEVTQGQWTKLGLANPSGLVESGGAVGQGECIADDCPVGNVNWFEATSYANLLSQRDGLKPCYALKRCEGTIGVGIGGLYCQSFEISTPTIYECEGYRLPTDPEWEYAARAGATTAFYKATSPPVRRSACV